MAGVSAESQRLRLEAVSSLGAGGLGEVTLWVDGQLLRRLTASPYQAWWPLEIGVHEAWAEAVTANGERLVSERVRFEVKADTP